jgi:rod shape-determining protein MreD
VSYLIVLFLAILAALLQSALLRAFLPHSLVPDLILLLVLCTSLLFPRGKGLLLSFALGLISDLFSGAPEGLNTMVSITLFATSKAVQARIFVKGFRAVWGLAILAFAIKIPYYALISLLSGLRLPAPKDALLIWLGELVSSFLLMPLVFYLFSRAVGLPGGWFKHSPRSNPA